MSVLQLLHDAKVNLETPNKDGTTPAFIAAAQGHVSVLQLLHDAKTNLSTSDKDGATPAFIAAHQGHVCVLQLLHDVNVNLEAPVVVSFFLKDSSSLPLNRILLSDLLL